MTTVISGWGPAGYQQYGKQFLETFDRYWPKDVKLVCYVEAEGFPAGRAEVRSLWLCDGMREFLDRNGKTPAHCGRAPLPTWKEKERAAGYSFRYDAQKFSRQAFIPAHAAQHIPDGACMAWLDADVVSFADVPAGMIEGLLGDADVCFLGRGAKHTELGFWAARLNQRTREFLNDFCNTYRSDEVFGLPQTHSAYVFDYCRRRAEKMGMRARDLTPGGSGHVWPTSPLGFCTEHRKGNRKYHQMRA